MIAVRHKWKRRVLFATVPGFVWMGLTAGSAQATGLTVTGTTVTTASSTSPTALPGFRLTGGSGTLLVTVATTMGQVALAHDTQLTLAYGYSSFRAAQVTFTGTLSAVNAGLASLSLVPGGHTGTAHVSVSVSPTTPGVAYSAETGHYYRFVSAPGITWSDARAAATASRFAGQRGYLAAIPSSTVNVFVAHNIPNATDTWFGGEATDYPSGYNGDTSIQRVWRWVDGPLAGQMFTQCSELVGACTHIGDSSVYTSWAAGEPNNYQGGESVPVTNWAGQFGLWNDLPVSDSDAEGYVVEYGGLVNVNDGSHNFTGVGFVDRPIIMSARPVRVPMRMPRVVAVSTASGRAAVRWSAPAVAGRAVAGYRVTATPGRAVCRTTGASATSCTLEGLRIGTRYSIVVSAVDSAGRVLGSAPTVVLNPAALRPVTVRFGYNSAEVTPAQRRTLQAAAAALATARLLRVDGYSETGGNFAANSALSRRRALAVEAVLRALGVRAQVQVVAQGGHSPVSLREQGLNRRATTTIVS